MSGTMKRWGRLGIALGFGALAGACGGGDTQTRGDTVVVADTVADTVADVDDDTLDAVGDSADGGVDTVDAVTDTVEDAALDTVEDDGAETTGDASDASDTAEEADTAVAVGVPCGFLDAGVFGAVRFEGDAAALRLLTGQGESPIYQLPPGFSALTACCSDACCAVSGASP